MAKRKGMWSLFLSIFSACVLVYSLYSGETGLRSRLASRDDGSGWFWVMTIVWLILSIYFFRAALRDFRQK